MTRQASRPGPAGPLPALAFSVVVALTAVSGTLAKPSSLPPSAQMPQTDEECLSCHGDPELEMTLPSGEILSLYISPEVFQASVHTPLGIGCRSCHSNIEGYPHPELEYASHRELSRSLYLACQRCHSDNYDRTLDSMHAQAAAAGNLDAPICTDCHGTHDIVPPDQPRARVSQTCGQCHAQIFEDYAASVHGSALIAEDNPDVPVCTDCHGVHNIQDPRTALFRVESPELCAGCHADADLMARYGLSSDVYSLYSLSWHGVDVSVYRANWPTIWHESAVCTDCHGVHDIRRTGDPASHVNPDNLLTTCRQCHPDAGPNWTGAWTGHNRVSLDRTPFVFYTQAFYDSFAPVVVWASGIYVFLQIVRATVARVRRSLR
jgi:predicted CXXCH cytochrome family protein